ncbi:MAG: hypothetical protein H6Q74_1750 [Firmicutes bacterium]|nr:hypothetical protein [Bacillota bacterium]
MKKTLLIMVAALALQVGTAFATPVIDLAPQQSALSLSAHGGDRSNDFSLTTQLTPTFAIGFQHVDWNNGGSMNDFFGQFYLDEKGQTRLILGNRTFSSESKMIVGVAATMPLADQWTAYGALLGAGSSHEFDLGANYKLTDTALLNFEYRSVSDHGSRNGMGIGLTTTF